MIRIDIPIWKNLISPLNHSIDHQLNRQASLLFVEQLDRKLSHGRIIGTMCSSINNKLLDHKNKP